MSAKNSIDLEKGLLGGPEKTVKSIKGKNKRCVVAGVFSLCTVILVVVVILCSANEAAGAAGCVCPVSTGAVAYGLGQAGQFIGNPLTNPWVAGTTLVASVCGLFYQAEMERPAHWKYDVVQEQQLPANTEHQLPASTEHSTQPTPSINYFRQSSVRTLSLLGRKCSPRRQHIRGESQRDRPLRMLSVPMLGGSPEASSEDTSSQLIDYQNLARMRLYISEVCTSLCPWRAQSL